MTKYKRSAFTLSGPPDWSHSEHTGLELDQNGNLAMLRPGSSADVMLFDRKNSELGSYNNVINAIMVDIQDLPGTPTAADFEFWMGNDNTPGDWDVVGVAPESLS